MTIQNLKQILEDNLGILVVGSSSRSSEDDEYFNALPGIKPYNLSDLEESSKRNSTYWEQFPGCVSEATKYHPGAVYGGGPVFATLAQINSDGSLPILTDGFSHNLSSEDLSIGAGIIAKYYISRVEEKKLSLQNSINEIKGVIGMYSNGRKPTLQDILNGRSFSEPVLQFGTPKEGLTSNFIQNTQKYREEIRDESVSPFMGKVGMFPECFNLIWGNYNIIKEGRLLLNKYLTFISDNLLKDPTIRPAMIPGKASIAEEFNSALSRYADVEWTRKDEAISLARELQSLHLKQIEWLESLKS